MKVPKLKPRSMIHIGRVWANGPRMLRSLAFRQLEKILLCAGMDPDRVNCNITLVDCGTMMRLNRRCFGKNKTTDIIAFKQNPHSPKEFSKEFNGSLGEMFLCLPNIVKRLRRLDLFRLDRRLERLMVHGVCHMMGYDHYTMTEYREMFPIECGLLKCLYRSNLVRRSRRRSVYIL
jgi:rRNA maturation RNase YbeY